MLLFASTFLFSRVISFLKSQSINATKRPGPRWVRSSARFASVRSFHRRRRNHSVMSQWRPGATKQALHLRSAGVWHHARNKRSDRSSHTRHDSATGLADLRDSCSASWLSLRLLLFGLRCLILLLGAHERLHALHISGGERHAIARVVWTHHIRRRV